MPVKPIIHSDFYRGEGKSSRDDQKFDSIYGLDIHSYPGQVLASNSMVKESGSTVTELVKCVAPITGDETLWFSCHTGKVWKRTSAGGWSLFHTLTSMTGGILGACNYHGQVFFATGNKLGRYNYGTNTWYENEHTFTRADAMFKPMVVQNLTLYIGDQDYIASVWWNGSTFVWNDNALDIPYEQRASTLGKWKGNLIIGTYSRSSESNAMVLVWDTYSDSWTYEDYVPERWINTIIPADNNLYMQCGGTGNLYFYDGVQLIKDKVLRGEITTPDSQGGFGAHQSGVQYKGQALFFGSAGIWSITNFNSELPRSIHKRYIPSLLNTGEIIGCITTVGDNLLVSYEATGGTGVDNISSNLYSGYLITPVAYGNYQNVEIKYASLPAGTSIGIETKINDGSWITQTPIIDSIRQIVYFDGSLGDVNTLQVKMTLNTSGTSTPVVDYIKIS